MKNTKSFICVALLMVATLFLGACNEERTTRNLVLGLSTLSSIASVQAAVVHTLQLEGEITDDEAKAFTQWVAPLPIASSQAIDVLASDASFEVRMTRVLQIFANANQKIALDQITNRKLRIAYVATTEALDAIEAQLRLLEKGKVYAK